MWSNLKVGLGTKISSTFNLIASNTEKEFKSKHNRKTSNFNTNHTTTDREFLGNKQIHNKAKYTCLLCKGDHKTSNCDKIKENPVHMRSTLIKEHKLCFNYISNDQMLNKCKSKMSCRVNCCTAPYPLR